MCLTSSPCFQPHHRAGAACISRSSLRLKLFLWWWKQKQCSLFGFFFLGLFLMDYLFCKHSYVFHMGGQFVDPLMLVRKSGSLAVERISWPFFPVLAANPRKRELQGTCAARYSTPAVLTCILIFFFQTTLFLPICIFTLENWWNLRNIGVFLRMSTSSFYLTGNNAR